MLPAFWYYLRGYVMISVSGFAVERFLNMATYRQILFWDASYRGTAMQMKTSFTGLQDLQYCADKTGCTLTVLAYGGLPARLRRMHGHPIFFAGIFCFVIALYVLSSFVWVVKVEGNERLSAEDILQSCADYQLHPGAWKANLDPEALTQALLTQYSDIAWVSIRIEGTQATVSLAETIEAPEIIDKETPCDMVAAKDGVILEIATERGTPAVAVGDVVKAGDVLISSEIFVGVEGEEGHMESVAASGSVQARTWTKITEELSLTEEQKVYDAEEKTNHILLVGDNLEIDWLRPHIEGTYDVDAQAPQSLTIGDWRLPLSIVTQQYRPYTTTQVQRTEDEAKQALESICRQKAEGLLDDGNIGDTIEALDIQYQVYTDCVRAECTVTMIEEIAQKQEKGM